MNNINMKDLENLKLLIQKWATDRNLHMDYPVTRSSTVCNIGRLTCDSGTNL